ncbi:putative disease resistance RPP13-like protein 1 [Phaseolus vulgaris]|uniref:putative disease resistance RPP13-like protein 1 n=1 Tax=Phaseolus vulgaris TaxID=3885 RepID=UPI0035CABD9F
MIERKIEWNGMKFCLVLDDVWNEHRDQWKLLQIPLKYGAKGSKILITTRINKVASTMESNNIHQLKQLQKDYSWQVFAKHAFQDDNSKSNSMLEEIGMKIVEKCQGLPLALETIGGLLQSKSYVSEWKGVLRSNIWDLPIEDSKIIPALLLSYYHLPSHLKRCFTYCALFSKDHEFEKESLIFSWMAENLLQCPHQSKSPEEVGKQYFNDLLSRSFFQQSIWNNQKRFVMHDLLNDLTKYVSGEMCYRLGVDRPGSVPKTTRHFSKVKNPIECDEYRSLRDVKRLRTFLFISKNCGMSIQDLISNFKRLRLLSLTDCHNKKEVPDTIANLVHLRSLDLSFTEIERLPDSISSLYKLQVLKLNYCNLLKELPSTLHELTKLCRLELKGTTLRKAPVLLGKLKKLQVWMSRFEVCKSSSEVSSIQQLGQLDLHGKLSIQNLENIVDPCDALAVDLKNKTHVVGAMFRMGFATEQ